jgi:hypothetical protein
MRLRSTKDYYRKGQLIKRIYEGDGSYEDIALTFRYQSAVGTTQSSGQLMSGFMHTETGATIIAITALKYAKGDKVILDDGETYEIRNVISRSFNEKGRIRGIRRSAFELQVT